MEEYAMGMYAPMFMNLNSTSAIFGADLVASARGPIGDWPKSGEDPSTTLASRLRDNFLSKPASLPVERLEILARLPCIARSYKITATHPTSSKASENKKMRCLVN
jgi:hypothetical protein